MLATVRLASIPFEKSRSRWFESCGRFDEYLFSAGSKWRAGVERKEDGIKQGNDRTVGSVLLYPWTFDNSTAVAIVSELSEIHEI